RGSGERVARGVHADRVHEVVHRDDGARALAHAHRLAVLDEVDHLPDEDLEVLARLVAEGRAHRHHAADVPVVVRAEHDDRPVEAALALVEVVGEVTREVGGVPVGLDDDAVLVVPQVRAAQPQRAVLFEAVTRFAQPRDRALDSPRLVHRVLVEEHVEVDAELVELLLDLREHQLHAARAEDLLGLVVWQRARVGLARRDRVRDHLGRDVLDVLPAVAVLWHLAAVRAGEEGPCEAVDLRAVVVEVVLARDVRAARGEQPRERVADGGPAHPADVQGPRGVRRDELEVDLLPRERLGPPVALALLDDRAGKLTRGRRLERDVEEARAGDVDARDPRCALELGDDRLGDRARRHTGLLRELEGDVGRPVAVLALAGSLDVDRLGQLGRVEGHGTGADGGFEGGTQRGRQLSRSHSHRVPSASRPAATRLVGARRAAGTPDLDGVDSPGAVRRSRPGMTTPRARTGLIEAAVADLRERITSGQWPVGTRIPPEPALTEMRGVG